MKKGLLALALGTFGFGIVEYGMMSILPDVASSFGISISQAGGLISTYALGVCAGAPLAAVFLRNLPLRTTLILLMCVYVCGNLLFALSESYPLGLAARFISGLPHGAFFGTGAIVASRLMPDRATTAVALMVMGMTVSNFIGVPAGSFVANNLSWHWIFYFAGVWGVVTAIAIRTMIRNVGSLPKSSLKGMFRFMRHPEPWLLIGATALCNGGAFAMYSYVSPVMTQAGMSVSAMPLLMMAVGVAMCAGNYFGGTLGDRFTPQRVALWNSVLMCCVLVGIVLLGSGLFCAVLMVLLITASLFAMSSPMQLLLIEYSRGGEMMGGAMVQVAFNMGNAIGAYAGGVVISQQFAARFTGVPGAVLALVSFLLLTLFMRRTANHTVR